MVRVSKFGDMAQPIVTKDAVYEGISWDSERIVNATGDVKVYIRFFLANSNPSVTFENVVHILGPDWETAPYRYRTPSAHQFEKTHPQGNSKIQYTVKDGHISRSIELGFHADGTLEDATFAEEMK